MLDEIHFGNQHIFYSATHRRDKVVVQMYNVAESKSTMHNFGGLGKRWLETIVASTNMPSAHQTANNHQRGFGHFRGVNQLTQRQLLLILCMLTTLGNFHLKPIFPTTK